MSAAALMSRRPPIARGVVLVGFRPAVSAAQRRVLQRRAGIAWLRGAGSGRRLDPGRTVARPANRRHVRARASTRDASPALRLLRSHGRLVRFAEPDYLMQASGAQNVPNDPSFGLAVGLARTRAGVNGTPGLGWR